MVQVISVAVKVPTIVQATLQISTVVVALLVVSKPLPLMTIWVPPALGPVAGATPVMLAAVVAASV